MGKLLKPLLVMLATAALVHLAMVKMIPLLIMDRVMNTMASGAVDAIGQDPDYPILDYLEPEREALLQSRGGVNIALPAPRPDARNQRVVRPSPDLLYSACVYDVSAQPLHVTAPAQQTYVSISGFAANTDNFFVINDQQLTAGADGEKHFNVLIVGPGEHEFPAPYGATVVQAPTDRGIVLFRSLVTSSGALDELYRYQAQQRCTPLDI